MGLKRTAILFLVLAILLIAIPGCNGTETGSFPEDYRRNAGMTISLSPVPKVGETTELTFIPAGHNAPALSLEDFSNTRVWVEFYYANTRGSYSEAKYAVSIPYDEVLVSGRLTWEGNLNDNSNTIELGGTIQLPREGFWYITGYVEAEGLDSALMEKTFEEEIRVAVTEDAARIINVIQDYSGPFAHLKNFSLLRREDVGYQLSPAYDVLNSRLVLSEEKEDMCLSLQGKRNNISQKDFQGLSGHFGLTGKQVNNALERLIMLRSPIEKMIEVSFLEERLRNRFLEIFKKRMETIFNHSSSLIYTDTRYIA